MITHPPWLPEARPLAIAHRAGNDPDEARRAFAAGADLIETDIWSYRGRLELRHVKTMGPLPLLWDRWTLEPGWHKRLVLDDLLQALPIEARLFLDLKGEHPDLGRLVVDAITRAQPDRALILCGRNWRQLDPVVDHPDVMTFYSVGSDDELAAIWERLGGMTYPAVSIHCRYLTPDIAGRLKDLGTTIVTWPINSITSARRLHQLDVDGFTTDNLWLIENIARYRADLLASAGPPDLPSQQGAGRAPADPMPSRRP